MDPHHALPTDTLKHAGLHLHTPGQQPNNRSENQPESPALATDHALPEPARQPSLTAQATADAYDALATQYAEFTRNEPTFPLDRAILTAFAELTEHTPGPVADLGCGPGRITAHLADLGLEVFGIDLSPAMIELARTNYPDLRFEVSSMDCLDLPDHCLAGIVSWYSIIHTPPAQIPAYLAEFHRALAPASHLLLAFFESEDQPVTPFDHAVTTAYRWPIDQLTSLANQAGFTETGRMLRQPHGNERFRRGHLLLRAQTP